MQVADLGITGAQVVRKGGGPVEVRLAHRSATGDVTFDWRDESFGTRSWFALLGPLLLALDERAVWLIDELDASLHSRFAAEVVRCDNHLRPRLSRHRSFRNQRPTP